MRPPFTDGWNSFWHLALGMLAVELPWTALLFLLYQFILKYDANSPIDTFEYLMGAVTYLVLCSLTPLLKRFRLKI
uniref:Uncharacterized protein n=1 Tax=viral metagenome TaxID=1070528 RepID=A0A6C0JZ64_9ZZZZ